MRHHKRLRRSPEMKNRGGQECSCGDRAAHACTPCFFPSPLGICSSFPQQAQRCESVPVALLASAKGTGRGLKRPAAPTEPSKLPRAAQKGISLKGPPGFACPTDSGYFPVNPFGPWGKAHSVKGDRVTWVRDKPWGSTSPG